MLNIMLNIVADYFDYSLYIISALLIYLAIRRTIKNFKGD